MRIVCPKCHAAYQVGAVIKNAILVCHRCNTEFDTYGNTVTADSETTKQFEALEENAPTFGLYDLVQTGIKNPHNYIWISMMFVLLLIIVSGIVMHWQHWKYSSLARAYQLQSNLSASVLDRDWRILPDTVTTQWLERDDQSLALLIEGEVENLVASELPTPEIRITFVTRTGKNIEIVQPITEPADLKTLKSAPFTSPPIDKTPVAYLGKRGFLLLIEDAPRSTQHILLHALAIQRLGTSRL